MDEYTEKYMQDNTEVFREASIDNAIRKIKIGGNKFNNLQDYVIALMKELDRNGDVVISFDEFAAGLKRMEIYMTQHEIHTLMRKFDHNNDGKISMEEFYNTLAQA